MEKLLTSALVRSPILTGGRWAGKKERKQGWEPLVTGTSTHQHQEPHSPGGTIPVTGVLDIVGEGQHPLQA